ncbi:hypothetical protein [Streptomyces albus]|uniref:Uncharacterized protein n=1 Tax=Streptomyces albus TaxID=1888 RepID=A0A8H1LBT4_9ACTN|nr:hypothetical protein [Streptomyces albus]TGG81680.1 hypothetical protein D8771_20070 [Streptomyces albus]UVN55661.1 hypothetical protein NR995_14880 [Streptomyces albus]
MSADLYAAVNCDGPDCFNAIHYPDARTATDVRRRSRQDGWHRRPGGRDLCPSCWKEGKR